MTNKHSVDIDYIANLARLELNEEEKTVYTEQLSDIITYFDKLSEVDTSGIEPSAHPFPLYNVWREDIATEPLTVEQAISNAPASRNNQIIVPKVIEEA